MMIRASLHYFSSRFYTRTKRKREADFGSQALKVPVRLACKGYQRTPPKGCLTPVIRNCLNSIHVEWLSMSLTGDLGVTTRTTLAPAQKLHLDRAARNAGEAFAFDEPDNTPAAPRSFSASLVWLGMAAVAVLGLSLVL
jgi:hypothetical protein